MRVFLREAQRRVERFEHDHHIPGFVPCDYGRAYVFLRALAAADVTPGRLFCEWGSGYGVVTCLAALLEFDAHGIEIAGELVAAARTLADDFDLPAEFVRGSFIPPDSPVRLAAHNFNWLATDGEDVRAEMSLGPDDFNVIFAYPWPDEETAMADLFDCHAMPGAVLVTYHGDADLRLRRKIERKRATPRRQPKKR